MKPQEPSGAKSPGQLARAPSRPGAPWRHYTPLHLVPAQHLLLLQRFDGVVFPRPLELHQEDLGTRERLGSRWAVQGSLYAPRPLSNDYSVLTASVLRAAHPLHCTLLSPLPSRSVPDPARPSSGSPEAGAVSCKREGTGSPLRLGLGSIKSCSKPSLARPAYPHKQAWRAWLGLLGQQLPRVWHTAGAQ